MCLIKHIHGLNTLHTFICFDVGKKNTSDTIQQRKKQVLDQIPFDGSHYPELPCGSVMQHSSPHHVCIFVMFCLECPVMACACTDGHQTDRQTKLKGWRRLFL